MAKLYAQIVSNVLVDVLEVKFNANIRNINALSAMYPGKKIQDTLSELYQADICSYTDNWYTEKQNKLILLSCNKCSREN